MQIFEATARVERTKEGVMFYEKDILPFAYDFTNPINVKLSMSYNTSGIGIAIARSVNTNICKSSYVYLVRISNNKISLYLKTPLSIELLKENSCLISPDNEDVEITFEYKLDKLEVLALKNNKEYVLATYTGLEKFPKYKLGIYSNAYNMIYDCNITSPIPDGWNLSMNNTRGGRCELIKDGFIFENCVYDAELEQYRLPLKKGTYYLSYEKDEINDKFDIETFVFLCDSIKFDEEHTMEDEAKNILVNNSFTLTSDSEVIIRFRGTNGKISKILLDTVKDTEYIPTKNKAITTNGSSILINTKDLKSISWCSSILSYPYYDKTYEIPFHIIKTSLNTITPFDALVSLDKKYLYTYDLYNMKLTVQDEKTKEVMYEKIIRLKPEDNYMINIMHNMDYIIYYIKLVKQDGKIEDFILDDEIIHHVPAIINSPIIVTSSKNDKSYDLSASYREVVNKEYKSLLFNNNYEMILPEKVPNNAIDFKIYGITKGTKIDLVNNTIEDYIKEDNIVPQIDYEVTKNIINVTADVKAKYKYFVLVYESITDYDFLFTNDEREVINLTQTNFEINKKINKQNKKVYCYAIPKNTYFNKDLIYRVPKNNIHSIDYCVASYDLLTEKDYTIDYENSVFEVKKELLDKYDYLIIDYKKAYSYSINKNQDLGQYEVKVTPEEDELIFHYDLGNNNVTNSYIKTDILPTSNKYIVLKPKGVSDEN